MLVAGTAVEVIVPNGAAKSVIHVSVRRREIRMVEYIVEVGAYLKTSPLRNLEALQQVEIGVGSPS
jgi:hypothetical protein